MNEYSYFLGGMLATVALGIVVELVLRWNDRRLDARDEHRRDGL